jgi:opacity protein-like surface antigen
MVSGVASFLGFLWVVSGGVIVLGFYQKQKPAARMNVGVGFRIGAVTGLMMTAALALALGTAGVVARFGVHRMAEFDEQVQGFEAQMTERMRDQKQSPEVQAEAQRLMNSAEVRGGVAVLYLGLLGGVLVLISAGGGAFAGMVGTRRQSARRML